VKCDAPLFVYSDYLFKEIFKSGKQGVTMVPAKVPAMSNQPLM